MKGITYEWKKFHTFRYFWFLCAVFLFFNFWTLSERMRTDWFSGESVKQIYEDFKAQPKENQYEWLEKLGRQRVPIYTGNEYIEKMLYNKIMREYMQNDQYEEYLKEIKDKSARISSVIFLDEKTFAYRNAQITPSVYEKMTGLVLEVDVSEGVIFSTHAEFTDLCMVLMLVITVYYLILYEKNNNLYPLLKVCCHGRGAVIGAKLIIAAEITIFLVLIFYGGNYLFACCQYGFGDLSRPIQSVTTMYESPYMLTVGEFLIWYLIIKVVVCYVIILLMIWISQKADTSVGAILKIGFVGVSEYLLSVLLPTVSYADGIKYINLVEYMKVYPLLSKYHNLDFFEYPVNAMEVFRIIIPCAILFLLVLNMVTFSYYHGTKKRWWRGKREIIRVGFITDRLIVYESLKNLLTSRTIWVCVAVIYGAVLVGNSVVTHRSIDEEYYKFYITEHQGYMTQEKLDYFKNERKKYEEIYAMTPKNSGLTQAEIEVKRSENLYAYTGFMSAYRQVQYIMKNNLAKGVNEQELVYEKGYEFLFGNTAMKQRLLGTLLCVIVAIYSSSAILGLEYELKVMNLLWSTKMGRKELLRAKIKVACGVTTVMFVIVKFPMVWKIAKVYPLENWGAKVRSMMFAGQSIFNCSIWGYALILLFMQLVTLFVIIFCVTALTVIFKDTMLTMIFSLLLFGGPLLMEWSGLSVVHYITLNGLLDAHWLLQGNWAVLILEIVFFWIYLPFAAGYILYNVYEERR